MDPGCLTNKLARVHGPAKLEEFAGSRAPLADIYRHATGDAPILITLISLFAIVNGALVQIIMAARVLYGMSREGWLPKWLGRVHRHTRTPLEATAVVTGTILILALWLPLEALARAASFVILVVFALINLALVRIKRRHPHPSGVRTYPLWVPVTGFLSSSAFVGYQLVILVTQ